MSVDPITGLVEVIEELDSPSSSQSSSTIRPQSPLVRGTHLDISVDLFKKRPNITNQIDNDQFQRPANRYELHGSVPPPYDAINPRERLDHIVESIQCVIDGKEEFISEQELLLSHPPNLEKTRFSMSKKKLKLQFMDDVLDRFDDERWMYPEQFARRRKLWYNSVTRSVNAINMFLDKESSIGDLVRPNNVDESYDDTSLISSSTRASTQTTGRGRPRSKATTDTSAIPKKRVRKAKDSTAEDGLATVSKLTLPAPAKKIPKKSTSKDSNEPASSTSNAPSKIPKFGRKKKEAKSADDGSEQVTAEKEKKKRGKKKASEDEECEATSPKKSRKEKDVEESIGTKKAPASKTKKHSFLPRKKGKNVAVIVEAKEGDDEKESCVISEKDEEEMEKDEETMPMMNEEMMENVDEKIKMSQLEKDKADVIKKRMEIYNMDDEDERKPVKKPAQKSVSQSMVIPMIRAPNGDDGMESDHDDWEPDVTPREPTPPRGLLSTSQDAYLRPSTPSSQLSHSSQSLFGSLSSSLMGSPNNSFSSQSSSSLSSSLFSPSLPPSSSFNLSSSLIPSQPLVTSTQITMKTSSDGNKVRPTFKIKKK